MRYNRWVQFSSAYEALLRKTIYWDKSIKTSNEYVVEKRIKIEKFHVHMYYRNPFSTVHKQTISKIF